MADITWLQLNTLVDNSDTVTGDTLCCLATVSRFHVHVHALYLYGWLV